MSLRDQLKNLEFAEQGVQFQRHASLLFTEDQASRMDMETVRALGSNGLEQLRLKDENFEAYESLFNPASIQTNRLMLTAQQGKDLNKQLDGFLSLLSPLFQLPAAHKALEWLVRRYHVHIYNVPELLKHFLPFHSTKVFVRLVQLLDIKIDDALWSFLKPFQKSGAVIERETLVRRAITDGNFVHFLCKSVADHRHETRADSSHIANLWSSVMVGVLEAICTDDLIQRVLPALVFTLKSPHSQLRSAAYIVLSAIARKQPLYIDVLEQLVAILVDSLAAPVVPQGLCCLAVLAQSQDIHVFKDTVLFKLIEIPNVSSEVSLISESFSIQPLLLLLGESLLPHALTNEACASKLLALLESCQFHGDSAETLGSSLFELYSRRLASIESESQKGKKAALAAINRIVSDILKALERQNHAVLDSIVQLHQHDDHIQALIALSLGGLRHTTPEGGEEGANDMSLFLGLQHHDETVRCLSLKHLKSTLDDIADPAQLSSDDHQFFQRIVTEILEGTHSSAVVAGALELGPWLGHLLSSDRLVDRLSVLIKDTATPASNASLAVQALFGLVEGNQKDEVALSLLDSVFLTPARSKTSRAIIKAIASLDSPPTVFEHFSELTASEAFAQTKKDKTHPTLALFNSALLKCLARNIASNSSHHVKMIAQVSQSSSALRATLALLLCAVLPLTSDVAKQTELFLGFLTLVTPSFARAKTVSFERLSFEAALTAEYLEGFQQYVELNRFAAFEEASKGELILFLHMFETAISALDEATLNKQKSAQPTSKVPQDHFVVASQVFSICTQQNNAKVFAHVLQALFSKLKVENHFHFLSLIWNHAETQIAERVAAVAMLDVMLCAQVHSKKANHSDLILLFTKLLISLSSQATMVRLVSLKALASLLTALEAPSASQTRSAQFTSSFDEELPSPAVVSALISAIMLAKEEIQHDPDHIFTLVADFFAELSQTISKKSKTAASNAALLHFLVSSAFGFSEPLLLDTLKLVRNQSKAQFCVPHLHASLEKINAIGYSQLSATEQLFVKLSIHALDSGSSDPLADESPELKAFLACLAMPNPLHSSLDGPQAWALDLISPVFFSRFSHEVACLIFTQLCDFIFQNVGSDIAGASRQVLSSVTLNAELVAFAFAQIVNDEEGEAHIKVPESPSSSQESRKRNLPETPHVKAKSTRASRGLSTTKLHKLEVLLDVLQSQEVKSIVNCSDLLPILFELLDAILLSDLAVVSSADQLTQGILVFLQNIYSVSHSIETEQLYVNVETIVRSIRGSSNPQTHHFALLLLAQIASLFPDRVLNSIMPIFTFMGSHVMRQDDNYSFRVIQRTIETVIPALLHNAPTPRKYSGSHVQATVASVVSVFVGALDHIPKHRRLPLFVHLAQTLSAKDHLHLLCGLILKKLVFHAKPKTSGDDTPSAQSSTDDDAHYTEFMFLLCNEFTVFDQVHMLDQLLQVLSLLPTQVTAKSAANKKASKPEAVDAAVVFLYDPLEYSDKQLRHLKYRIISYVLAHLNERKFLNKVGATSGKHLSSVPVADNLKATYLSMLETLLTFVASIRLQMNQATEGLSNLSDFWQAMSSRVYDVIDRVNGLLKIEDFVHVVGRLIHHSDLAIRRKVMTLFGSRVSIGSTQSEFNQEEVALLLSVSDEFINVIKAEASPSMDSILTRQTAIFSLNILASCFGSTHADKFTGVLSTIGDVLKDLFDNMYSNELIGSALTCFGTLCSRLGNQSISALPRVLPGLLSFLEGTLVAEDEAKIALVQHGALATLLVVIKILPTFVSPYLSRALAIITHSSLSSSASSKLKDRQDSLSLAAKLRTETVSRVATRILLPAFFEAYHNVNKVSDDESKEQNLIGLLELFVTAIRQLEKKDVPQFHKNVFKFFLVVADYRAQCSAAGFVSPSINRIEEIAISSLIELIMKLSDSVFHPMYLKIVDWSLQQDAPVDRAIVLFKCTDRLASALKSLFVPYFGHVFNLMTEILGDSAALSSALLASDLVGAAKIEILTALEKCFLYDAEKFLTKERFHGLLTPLISQLKVRDDDDEDNAEDDSDDEESDDDQSSSGAEKAKSKSSYELRVDAAVPCIAQLCVAAGTPALRKQLNHAVLMLTRDKDARVRCSAIRAIERCYLRLGDDFLSFLPETVPFVAELLEDDNINVERQCKQLIATIESYLGESLSKYF